MYLYRLSVSDVIVILQLPVVRKCIAIILGFTFVVSPEKIIHYISVREKQ